MHSLTLLLMAVLFLSNQQRSAFDAARKAITAMASGKPSETVPSFRRLAMNAYDLDPTGMSASSSLLQKILASSDY